jgi:hypothetical protein
VKSNFDSVYNQDNGWLCDCGHWTTGDDNYHIPIEKAEREIYFINGLKLNEVCYL